MSLLLSRTYGHKPKSQKNAPVFSTNLGDLYVGNSLEFLEARADDLKGKVDLIFTSPPFPLNDKKKYGNLQGEAYLTWLAKYAPLFYKVLSKKGSIVIEIGNAWEPKKPVQSILPYQSLLKILETGPFVLCQEVVYYNPARLPSPAQWVTIDRVRLKDATTKIWWMSKTENPKANNRNVLQPYSAEMNKLLKRGTYNAGTRPSEHEISETGFLKDNGGSIAPNLIKAANTASNLRYQLFCKEAGIKAHPARMPEQLPEFFIKFLTDENDLVLDPFGGSNTTGYTAEKLGRQWLTIEADARYAAASVARFDEEAATELLEALPEEDA